MENLLALPIGKNAPHEVHAVIEVPQGSTNKYEYDPDLNVVMLDRVLYSAMYYPGDYGFIPSTLADDGDPVDVVVLMSFPTLPGVVMNVRPLGFLEMSDEKGRDQKVLAVPVDDPRFADYQELSDVPSHKLEEIAYFFDRYKDLEGKEVTIGAWSGKAETLAMIEESMVAFNNA